MFSFAIVVILLAGALDAMSRTMQVEIDLANPNGRMATGMYVKALMKKVGQCIRISNY